MEQTKHFSNPISLFAFQYSKLIFWNSPPPGSPLPQDHNTSVSVSWVLELQTCVTYQGFQIIVFNRYVVKCFKPLILFFFFQDMNEPSSFVNGTVINRCRNDTLNYPPYFPGRIWWLYCFKIWQHYCFFFCVGRP